MDDLIQRYNYDAFVPDKFMPWLNFGDSPPVGERGPDFPLWNLKRGETNLHAVLSQFVYTIVEFGSFT